MLLWADLLSKLWFSLVAGSRRKIKVRLTEFIKRKFMYMKNKKLGTKNAMGTDVATHNKSVENKIQ